MAILLHDVLNLDRLLSEYQAIKPSARIKFRFNESWHDVVGTTKVWRDQLEQFNIDKL